MHILLLTAALFAQPATQPSTEPAPPEPGFALTVYSTADPAGGAWQQIDDNPNMPLPGYGVVRETRKIDLQAGQNRFDYTGVAAGIDPTTVRFRDFTDPDARVLEQNFEFDLINSTKLLQSFVGKEVLVDGRVGTLLSAEGYAVFKLDNAVRMMPMDDFAKVVALPDAAGLITEPTLQWELATDQAGEHLTQTTYQTDGLTWRADYTIITNADDTAVDVGAWVTLMNRSGIDYPDTHLKLIAGDVQRVQPPQNGRYTDYADVAREARFAGGPGFEEKSFFEYHLYTLPRTTTLANNSTKQIELFPQVQSVPTEKIFVYYGVPEQWRIYRGSPNTNRDLGTEMNKQVDVYLKFKNAEEHGMGMPLPTGLLRVYKRDAADDSLEFIGEDTIDHTPREEDVLVKLGSAFDIVGERKITEFRRDGDNLWETIEVKVRNRKKTPVKVLIKEPLFRWSTWEITESSQEWEKQDSRTVHFPVTVQPDEEATVTYTVHYFW